MSLSAAIDLAVRQQLGSDGRPLPQSYQETLGDTYKYTVTTLRGFLIAIAYRLRNDTPSYVFDWNSLDPNTCLTDTVQLLEAAIASATSLASGSAVA